MKILLASDHAGVDLKKIILDHLQRRQISVVDFGPMNLDSVDYPDYAHQVCKSLKMPSVKTSESEVQPMEEFGILICGSGQGMAMTANKHSHIRAALCHNAELAKLSREHNNANILCLGARFLTGAEALVIVDVFINTPFSGGRHSQRISKMSSLR